MSNGQLITFPLTAPATKRPCAMYMDHGSARPAFTQGHHVRPEYLQKRLWGEVRITDIIWLCGTCHDNLHGWLYMIMGEWRMSLAPSDVPQRARSMAEHTVVWYLKEAA